MQNITITTPDNIEIEYRLAGAGSRMAAAALDMLIQTILFLIVAAIMIFLLSSKSISGGGEILGGDLVGPGFSGYTIAFAIIAYFIIYFGYYVVCEMIMNGRSIGKKVFKLRVIRENGQPIGLVQSVIRNLFRYFIDIFGVGIICVMFTKKCKRPGDMVASTIVIAENPGQITADSLNPQDLPEAEAIVGTRMDGLSPDEYYLLKEYFHRRKGLLDKGERLRQMLTDYFNQ